MPFKSEAQRRMMWAKHPAVARRWAKKYGSLPVNKGAGVGQVANQAKQKSKPVISKAETPTQSSPTPSNPPPSRVVPLPRPKTKPVVPPDSESKRQQITAALNRYRQRAAAGSTTTQLKDRVQKMQQRGLMIKNVGAPDYNGPIKKIPERNN